MSADGGDGRPPRAGNGQFAKGISGNRRGRPRKAERAFTQSQIRHDVLGLMEKEVDIKVMGKNERMPVILAIYWSMLVKAVGGDDRMMLKVTELRTSLLRDHKEANYDLINSVEEFEKGLARNGEPVEGELRDLLQHLRKRTRGN